MEVVLQNAGKLIYVRSGGLKVQCIAIDTTDTKIICLSYDNEILIAKYNVNDIMKLNIQKINGRWTEGYALDIHTTSSTPIREIKTVKMTIDGKETDVQVEGEIIGWDTKRPEIAELLYQLKYRYEKEHINAISTEAANFLKSMTNWNLHKIIPIPPSDSSRSFQPVYELAKAVGSLCNIEVDFNTLKKLKSTSQLKSIEDPAQRREVLKDAFDAAANSLTGKNILLFDDLFRSGETLNAAYDVLKSKGNATNIYVLTITKTRSKR